MLLVIIIFPISFNYFKLYESYRTQSLTQIFIKIVKSVFIGIVLLNFAMYLLKISDVSRIMMGIFLVIDILFLCLSKSLIYKTLKNFREKGYNFQNLLIIGVRERAKEVIRSIKEKSSSGFRILGCLGLSSSGVGKIVDNDTYCIGTVAQLEKFLIEHVVDQIIFALPLDLVNNIEKHIRTAEELGVSVRIIPDWNLHKLRYNPGIGHLEIEDFLSIPTMCLSTTPSGNGELQIKNLFDFFGAAC